MADDPITDAVRRSIAARMDRMLLDAFFPAASIFSDAVANPRSDESLTLEKVMAAAAAAGTAFGRFQESDGDVSFSLMQDPWSFAPSPSFGGMQCVIKDAQEQARTPRDVRGPWTRPGRVPSKRVGRKGTRRAWKRAHPPGYVWYYREPTDVLVLNGQMAIATPRQWDAIKRATPCGNAGPSSLSLRPSTGPVACR
jgi:hypothetical protein